MGIAGTVVRIEQVIGAVDTSDERAALREVFHNGVDALYRFILVRVGGCRDVADDLLQQTCFEAVRHRRPPVDRDKCEAWCRGIARNLIRRHWRRVKRDAGQIPLASAGLAGRLADDLESRPLPADAMIREELLEQLLLAVTSLSAADQGLIFAHYFDGRSQAVIAGESGVSRKSVESRLARARGRLRKALRSMERSGER